jgi:hypothetical protein
MADEKMKAGDNPADFNGDEVNEFLAGADDAEKARVLEAEAAEDGKKRKGILEGPHAGTEEDPEEGDDSEDAAEESTEGENEELRPITGADLNPLY